MEIGDSGHGNGLSHRRSKDMSTRPASIDRDIVTGRINRGCNLPVPAKIYVFG